MNRASAACVAARVKSVRLSIHVDAESGCGACATGSAGDGGAAWAWVLGCVAFARRWRRRA